MRKFVIGVLALIVVVAAAGWWQRPRLLSWYYVRQLAVADDRDRDVWVVRVTDLEPDCVPVLCDLLSLGDARACANVHYALMGLMEHWGRGDQRSLDLVNRLADQFSGLSSSGKETVLALTAEWMSLTASQASPGEDFLAPAVRLLTHAATEPDNVRSRALTLAAALLPQVSRQEVRTACRSVVIAGLADPLPDTRLAAVRLAMRPGIDLLTKITPLLSDPVAEVRTGAVVALADSSEVVPTDDLLRWLHDPDVGVRRATEAALRGRGLREADLRLGKLVTDPKPGVRLQVLGSLWRTKDVEPVVWLMRLGQDIDPAVRAAAVRAAAEQSFDELKPLVQRAAQVDPNPTVRQIALYYLNHRQGADLYGN